MKPKLLRKSRLLDFRPKASIFGKGIKNHESDSQITLKSMVKLEAIENQVGWW